MRIQKLELHNIANIKNLTLDLEKIGPGIIAIIGENGSGKTHLMESLCPTPLFREWPYYRKSGAKAAKQGEGFIEHCTGTHGTLINTLVYGGSTYTLTLKGQPSIKKQEAYCEIDGVTKNQSGKLTEYDVLIAKHFPSADVIFSAPFATQNAIGSFFRLDRDARRTLFARLLGVEHYEEYANESMDEAKEEQSRIAEYENLNGVDIEFIERNNIINEKYNDLIGILRAATENLAAILPGHIQKSRERDLENDEYRILAHRDKLTIELGAKIVDLRIRLAGIKQPPETNIEEIEGRRELAEQLYRTIDEVYIKPLGRLRQEYEAAYVHFIGIHNLTGTEWSERDKVFSIRRDQVEDSYRKNEETARSLDMVDKNHPMCKRCPLTHNAFNAMTSYTFTREQYEQEESIYGSTRESYERIRQDSITTITVINSLMDKVDLDIERWHIAQQALRVSTEEYSLTINEYVRLEQEQDLAQNMWWELEEYERQLEGCRLTQGESNLLHMMNERYREVFHEEADILSLQEKILTIHDRMDDMKHIIDEMSIRQIAISKRMDAIETCRSRVSLHTILSDLLLFMRSSTIEASRPQVEEIANELLGEYREGRFRIEFSLAPKKKDGKEEFTVRIYDTRTGTYRTSGSGGEQAIIDEALRLAFCIVNANRSGAKFETLFRDETTSAMTREHAGSYVQMLRRAMKIGEFHQIIFVTHHETVWRQADVMLEMKDGKIEVGFMNG